MKLSERQTAAGRSGLTGLIFLGLCVLLSACTMGSPGADIGRQVVDNYYQALQQENVDADALMEYFSDNRAPEVWRSHLKNIRKSLGKVDTFEYKGKEVNTVFSGRFYIFEYQVNYDSGKGAKETLTLFDSVDSDDQPKIVSHVIAAEGFEPIF